ncbi:uncharacterized protein LOC134293759 isoform X2 [Anolis carolinensis]|uniref:uncharacterized protein LOC134293759 isoform X2 n=1 Tax=Anolis carolinensis TaxID=28377 RepID=UPI002F2B86A1
MGVLLGGKSPAPSTLLAAFILSVCFFSTEAFWDPTDIMVEPSNSMVGGSVLLTPLTLPSFPSTCRWFRGGLDVDNTIVVFFFYPRLAVMNRTAFTGREIITSNCTLEIIGLSVNDTANYTALIESATGIRRGTVELLVSAPAPDEPASLMSLPVLEVSDVPRSASRTFLLAGRGFSRSTIAAIILAILGATIILTTVVVLIKRSPRPQIRTLVPAVSPGVKEASLLQGGKNGRFPSPVAAQEAQSVVKVEESMESGGSS